MAKYKYKRRYTNNTDDSITINRIIDASYVSERIRRFTKADTDHFFVKDNTDRGDGYRPLSVQSQVKKVNSNKYINTFKVRVKD